MTSSIILCRHVLTLAQGNSGEGKKGEKIQKNMYICININSRVTEFYHTLKTSKERVKTQNVKDT